MEAWLFKRRMNAEMTLYCRQVISRSDLRCSALLPLLLLLSLCGLLQWADPLIQKETLRDDWWKARGLSPVPSRLVCGDCSPPSLPAISLPPPLFVRLVVGINETAETSTGLFEKNKRGGGFNSGRPGDTDMNALFTHLQCFLWPKQLVFVVKRLIRKKTPLCWRSQALTKGQQQLNSDKSVCFFVQTLFSISAFHQKASIKRLWLIYNIVKMCATKEDSKILFKFYETFFFVVVVDYVKRG